jgi:hypothetical protein
MLQQQSRLLLRATMCLLVVAHFLYCQVQVNESNYHATTQNGGSVFTHNNMQHNLAACKKAALIFFGVPKHFPIIWKSYIQNIIKQNPQIEEFEVYMHMYEDLHQHPFSNSKNGELNETLESPDDIRAVFDNENNEVHIQAKLTTTSQAKFDELELTWLQESDKTFFYNYSLTTVKNVFRQGNSLREAYNYLLTEKRKEQSNNDIDVYIFARPDTFLMSPIDVPCLGLGDDEIWVPSRNSWWGINDRFAIAGSHAANVYANRIYGYKDAVLARRINLIEIELGMRETVGIPPQQFNNSETLLRTWLLGNNVKIIPQMEKWAKLLRVRAGGRILPKLMEWIRLTNGSSLNYN